jgi:hypothetical protein
VPVSRVVVDWSGWPGGTGNTVLHFADIRGDETGHLDKVRTFLVDVLGGPPTLTLLPSAVKLDINPIVQTFDENTGELVGTTIGTKPLQIVGGGGTNFSSPVGACIAWTTNLIHPVPGGAAGPHLVRGKTFLVPLSTQTFDSDGSLAAATLTDMNAAVAAFLAANPDFVIWSRPVAGAGGAFGVAVAGVVRDKMAVLRSRRD